MAGPGGDGVIERVPRWERWKFRFEPESAAEFARWLDAYKIRVGVLGRDNKVYVAYNFSSGTPTVESDTTGKYNGWGRTVPTDGPMPRLIERFARKANIARHGSIRVLFFSFDVESILWTIEKKYSNDRDVNTIRETVFTVTRDGGQYQFKVIDQKYFF
ncbi:MAG: hypothetical protein L3J13_05665 [Devosiaceae bacterium]|nr:hypothetical protein [Devosiaceae bacterium]